MGPIGPMLTPTWRMIQRMMLSEGFADQLLDRYPQVMPWTVAKKVLDHHGVPQHVYSEEGPEAGLPPWGSGQVETEKLLAFLGY